MVVHYLHDVFFNLVWHLEAPVDTTPFTKSCCMLHKIFQDLESSAILPSTAYKFSKVLTQMSFTPFYMKLSIVRVRQATGVRSVCECRNHSTRYLTGQVKRVSTLLVKLCTLSCLTIT